MKSSMYRRNHMTVIWSDECKTSDDIQHPPHETTESGDDQHCGNYIHPPSYPSGLINHFLCLVLQTLKPSFLHDTILNHSPWPSLPRVHCQPHIHIILGLVQYVGCREAVGERCISQNCLSHNRLRCSSIYKLNIINSLTDPNIIVTLLLVRNTLQPVCLIVFKIFQVFREVNLTSEPPTINHIYTNWIWNVFISYPIGSARGHRYDFRRGRV